MLDLDNVTLCLTIGKRPVELEQSLSSLLSYVDFQHIIAINDFGDAPTNEVFLDLCPKGELIDLQRNLGHHKAIDYMYAKVQTDYIFHSEDDWLFDKNPDLDNAAALLDALPQISCVAFRKIEDFIHDEQQRNQAMPIASTLSEYVRLDNLHDQWHGYSFNPHLVKKSLWQHYAPFAQFKKERHISRYLRKHGHYMAYLKQGACHHIGFDSVANPPKTFWQKLKFW